MSAYDAWLARDPREEEQPPPGWVEPDCPEPPNFCHDDPRDCAELHHTQREVPVR